MVPLHNHRLEARATEKLRAEDNHTTLRRMPDEPQRSRAHPRLVLLARLSALLYLALAVIVVLAWGEERPTGRALALLALIWAGALALPAVLYWAGASAASRGRRGGVVLLLGVAWVHLALMLFQLAMEMRTMPDGLPRAVVWTVLAVLAGKLIVLANRAL